MKQFLAILLAATLALSCAYAEEAAYRLNENSDTLDFYLAVPAGMTMAQEAFDPGIAGTVTVEGMPDLLVFFSLMPDDSYTDQDMSELSTADIETLSGLVIADLGESTTETYDMPCGLKALIIRDVANTEYIAMTLKDGYFFHMMGCHEDFSPLSDEEAQAVKAAFDSLSVESKKAE